MELLSSVILSITRILTCNWRENLRGSEVNLAYELLNIQQSIDGLMSILSVLLIHVALVHVRVE